MAAPEPQPEHRMSQEISDRSRGVALILATVLGVFGGHRFYAGKHVSGVLQAVTVGGLGLWWLYDMIVITAGEFRDDQDRKLVRWWESSPLAHPDYRALPQMEVVLDAVDALRGEVGELNERVDFMERILAQVKEPHALPGATAD
jgi:hypothetical protein